VALSHDRRDFAVFVRKSTLIFDRLGADERVRLRVRLRRGEHENGGGNEHSGNN
jgi:hypothetical protein